MSNVVPLRSTGGFTRMDNDLYAALIGADLSARELRVALAVHRLTAGYNKESVKVAAMYIAKMMYGESGAESERANVSRAINSLIRHRVLFRAGGSRDPITFLQPREWKIERRSSVLESTHCVENIHATVLEATHTKERNTKATAYAVVAAIASTGPALKSQTDAEPEHAPNSAKPVSKGERIPYDRIVSIYNAVCGEKLPKCMKLTPKRRTLIKGCWNLEIEGRYPFRASEFWEGYFNDCLTNQHWVGANDRGWTADIEFLTRQDKVLKVLEAV